MCNGQGLPRPSNSEIMDDPKNKKEVSIEPAKPWTDCKEYIDHCKLVPFYIFNFSMDGKTLKSLLPNHGIEDNIVDAVLSILRGMEISCIWVLPVSYWTLLMVVHIYSIHSQPPSNVVSQ